MTPEQLSALKAAIAAQSDVTFAGYRDAGNTAAMAAWYNEAASPTFTVWKTSVDADEFRAAMVWTEVAGLTDLKQRTLQMLLAGDRVFVSSQNIRDAFSAIFSAGSTLTALAALAKRTVTRGERVFATGTGSNGTPGALGYDGAISNEDIINALKAV